MTKRTFAVLISFSLYLAACGSNSFEGKTDTQSTAASAEAGESGNLSQTKGAGKKNPDGTERGGIEQSEEGGGGSGAQEGSSDPVQGGKVSVGDPTPSDKESIANCSKAWGTEAPGAGVKVRKIVASVSVLGGGTLIDSRKTEEPELTLVLASVNVLSKLDWKLLNPNGWYCIVASVNVLSSMTITIDKDAHLADSRVAVDILSSGDSVGAASVNVLSSVKVIKQ